MHAITKLAPLVLLGGMVALQGCEDVSVDTTGGGTPPAGVIRGTVTYDGPPPCSQGGHIVGNAVILVFDARNPPPPGGLGGLTGLPANFGVVSGDVLFSSLPVEPGPTKVCPPADASAYFASAPYAISPMSAGQYIIEGFYDYTGNFFATFKSRDVPEATDVAGGYIDINDAQKVVQNPVAQYTDAGTVDPYQEQQANPNYAPVFLPVNIGTQGVTPGNSLRNVPTFTMPDDGFLADNVPVTLALNLSLSRPYFYPSGVTPSAAPLSPIVSNGSSGDRPAAAVKTPENPSGDVNFIPVLSFPQDIQIYAAPTPNALELEALSPTGSPKTVLSQYQSALPELQLKAGVPTVEQTVAADTLKASNPFHMQLGLSNPPAGAAPGGNGGIFVWWNACDGLEGCNSNLSDYIPEAPGLVYRMWPLVVLAKLDDLGSNEQPDPADPESIIAQGSDLQHPIIIIQGITLNGDTFLGTTTDGPALSNNLDTVPLPYPDMAGRKNLQDHVSVLLRPSTLCIDPRAPDQGGVLVTPGIIDPNGNVEGKFPPADTKEKTPNGTVVASGNLSNPQLDNLVNHNAAGSTNGLMGGCLPTGRYQINVVYPTGQAWTTPNETGSCAAAEGTTLFGTKQFPGSGASGKFPDPLLPSGCSAFSKRPVLYSQGTRAVVEITPAASSASCATFAPNQSAPKDLMGKPIPNGVPFVCTGLCPDPRMDPTALSPTGIPCYKPFGTAPVPGGDAGP